MDDEDADVIVQMALLLSEAELDAMLAKMYLVEGKTESLLWFLYKLQGRFGSLFIPIFPFNFVIKVMAEQADAMVSSAEAPEDKARLKKKKKSKRSPGYSLSVERSLQSVGEFLVHIGAGGGLGRDQLVSALSGLVRVLQIQVDLDVAQRFLEPVFCSLALACAQSDWQTLHHTVTRQTKSASVATRRAAMSIIKNLFEKIGADYLVLLPDTLPCL